MNRLTLPLSLSTLIESIGDQKRFTPSAITQLIRQANIQNGDLLEWADFEHNKQDGYGRKMVYKQPHFEIMVMSWAAFDSTAVHNHGHTNWGAVQVFGKLEHTTFDYEDNYLTTNLKEKLDNGDVISVGGDLIHQMVNQGEDQVLSLHIYGTSNTVDNITEDSQLFDISKKEIQLVNGGVFYDLLDKDYRLKDEEFETDRLTEIGHYVQLLHHYHKTNTKGAQYQTAINYFHDRSFESRLITELEMDNKRILYFVELSKARKLLETLSESTKSIDAILNELNGFDRYS
jgi:predicted metal-dependent enzyme (double-stranded beta helix superfamily)